MPPKARATPRHATARRGAPPRATARSARTAAGAAVHPQLPRRVVGAAAALVVGLTAVACSSSGGQQADPSTGVTPSTAASVGEPGSGGAPPSTDSGPEEPAPAPRADTPPETAPAPTDAGAGSEPTPSETTAGDPAPGETGAPGRPTTPEATAVAFVHGILTGATVDELAADGVAALARDRLGRTPVPDPVVTIDADRSAQLAGSPDRCAADVGAVRCYVRYPAASGPAVVAVTVTELPLDVVVADDGETFVMPDGSSPPPVPPTVTSVEPLG